MMQLWDSSTWMVQRRKVEVFENEREVEKSKSLKERVSLSLSEIMRNSSPCSLVLPFFLLISLICFHSSSASSKPQNSLYRGSSLSVEDDDDLLTSPDKSFTCGFYQVGTNAYCFSIWFTNSANKTVVWMANRDQPVHGQGSRILLSRDGTMVLSDADGSTVWSSDNITNQVDRAELLNTGNLVLKDTQGNFLWQSFDSPTDTLLPLQPVTNNKKLISVKGNGTYATGHFSFYFNNDNTLRLMYDGPEISSLYWPNPDYTLFQNGRTNYNSSRIAVLDQMGRFSASDRMEFNASDMGLGIKRRLTMDYDGNLRLYSLNESTGSWAISWEALPQACNVHGLCGRNGICVYSPKPMCSCPPGFERTDPRDWNKGCKPKFKQTCNKFQQVKFVELPQIDFYGYDSEYHPSTPLEACMKLCADDCSCEAISYKLTGDGNCFTKSALFNGYKSPNFQASLYLKLPRTLEISNPIVFEGSELICNSSGAEILMGSSDMRAKYLYWFVSVLGVIEILFITSGWWFLYRRHSGTISPEDGYRVMFNEFRKFTYGELKKATKQFKEELGRGGSGVVYKGVLGDNRVVAVKKLDDVIQGEEEFWAEVSTIGRINHINLVRMWGFCSERAHRLLVYEYLENRSLDKHLFYNVSSSNSNSVVGSLLGWDERVKIALGAAKGLAYLHHECLEWVVHCDVKPENILLDFDFESKIADFGLAKLSQRGGSAYEFSRIRGTKGYMAPEWALNLPITAKVDVYSFGILVLEIVKGVRLSDCAMVDGEFETEAGLTRLVRVVKRKIEHSEDSWIEDIIDPRLNEQFNHSQAATMVEIGISCVEEDRNKRPTMDSVVQAFVKML